MRKSLSIVTLCIYLFFSQFVIKAVATTHASEDISEVDFCINEQLDTLESKRNCRKMKNTASFSSITYSNVSKPFPLFTKASFTGVFLVKRDVDTYGFIGVDPPDDPGRYSRDFSDTYVGVILLLL